MVSMNRHSYKAVYMHGWVNDAQGRKMSKSLGNYIVPEEVISKYGADTLRYYTIGGANPGLDINYNFEDMKIKHKNLMVLWNLHKLLIGMVKETGTDFDEESVKAFFSTEEEYIFSKLNSAIEEVTKMFNEYRLNEIPMVIEELFLELSRTYVQLIREKSSVGSEDEKKVTVYTLYNVLLGALKLFAPAVPFITEAIFQNLKQEFKIEEDSIHLAKWPSVDNTMINKELEAEMEIAGSVIQGILSARERIQQGVRWPLKEAIVVTKKPEIKKAVESLNQIIKTQTNVKDVEVREELAGIIPVVKADYATIGPDFQAKSAEIIAHISTHSPATILNQIEEKGKYEFELGNQKIDILKKHLIIEREVPEPYAEAEIKGGFVYINKEMDDELEVEGYAREVMRRVQALRKKAGMEKQDKIALHIKANEDLVKGLDNWVEQIKSKCGADKIKISETGPAKKHKFSDKVKIKDYEFELSFDKV